MHAAQPGGRRLTNHLPPLLHPLPQRAEDAAPSTALLLVGYDTTRAGRESWLAKASFGAGFGERGFVRVALTESGVCGLYRNVFQSGSAAPVSAAKAPAKASTPAKAATPAPKTGTASAPSPAPKPTNTTKAAPAPPKH